MAEFEGGIVDFYKRNYVEENLIALGLAWKIAANIRQSWGKFFINSDGNLHLIYGHFRAVLSHEDTLYDTRVQDADWKTYMAARLNRLSKFAEQLPDSQLRTRDDIYHAIEFIADDGIESFNPFGV